MSMKVMYDLKDMLCAELDEIGKKAKCLLATWKLFTS